ncbi:DEAD/DEAH box helicase [uncultured Desulfobulbus sp.]|uniref:DEAD/DEAH box helicase n=1 Tax=uncultured Desulfobulbus sp. TaxID=239745 RepID=UPI0029C660E7|nr:DEAD/DEAH box helicase [uncultured Desulfobulbus sp.]
MSFSLLDLSEPLLRALDELSYTTPTPVQLQAIPAIGSGRDVIAVAQTGTGKTAAFSLPLLQRLANGSRVKPNHIRALVLVPTRELAVQVAESIAAYGKYLPLKKGVVYGGVKINPQMMRLRSGVDILVATPGRLLDLFQQNAVKFLQVETLVLDEADRMLDLGFMDDISKILGLLPKRRQGLLFSATFPNAICTLAEKLLKRPVHIEVDPPNSAAISVKQWIYEVDKGKKPDLLCQLLRHNDWQQVLVFIRTRINADRLVRILANNGISALAIHGDKSQGIRAHALAAFKAKTIRILVATDIASRGIDISELSHVINLDLPKVAEDYIHRIGRTGRAGLEGVAISLVSADEVNLLSAIETLIHQQLVREVVAGFIPKQNVPLTRLMKARPKRPKKAKQV